MSCIILVAEDESLFVTLCACATARRATSARGNRRYETLELSDNTGGTIDMLSGHHDARMDWLRLSGADVKERPGIKSW